ncbi:MAG: F0F1 ATP synthase subunit epsilon [Candidatus Cloacimonetes bacterium]|jgi:F-type H+-transporting ATPase subunit epsilon|nr:F0F1 ATP synthase subunit epsilon [Candidatus Cloacimonadota bacterium]MBT6994880.1 F0F1 ATP synthase subunit epsilon [Candidatus Cloacimonadota bacterium]MBT7468995.1 F0F1 ATP synthase subunit epsilon [Candidatus Cloacimonadota bacterium]
MDKILLEVIQPTQTEISLECDHVIVPGVDGDFGVDFNHTSFVTLIRPGILRVYQGENLVEYAIHEGFVTVEDNKIVIICETIESVKNLDVARAKSAKERAEKRLKSSSEKIDYRRAEASLKRAIARLAICK